MVGHTVFTFNVWTSLTFIFNIRRIQVEIYKLEAKFQEVLNHIKIQGDGSVAEILLQ